MMSRDERFYVLGNKLFTGSQNNFSISDVLVFANCYECIKMHSISFSTCMFLCRYDYMLSKLEISL